VEAVWRRGQRQSVVGSILGETRLTRATDNGSLTEAELRTALVNGDWSPFDPHTVRMMIRYSSLVSTKICPYSRSARMFDTDRSGSVNFDEFWYVSRFLLLTPI
jgi:hypothetical protein